MQTFQNRMLHEIVVQVSNTIHGPFVPFQLLQVFESVSAYVFRALNAAIHLKSRNKKVFGRTIFSCGRFFGRK